MKKNIVEKIKSTESTFSLVLGVAVVIIVGVLFFNYFKGLSSKSKVSDENSSVSITGAEDKTSEKVENEPTFTGELPVKYTIKKGDSLWKISVYFYNTGYNWVDIGKENNIKNSDILFAGDELTIPNVQPKILAKTGIISPKETGNSITGGSYTVQKGDSLWKISVRAYQDGFKWPEIAKANKVVVDPNKIEIGTVLTLPR